MDAPSTHPGGPRRAPHRPLEVVAALIFAGPHVLVQQRLPHKPLPLLWEFPGGKCEPGEDDAVALRRECREELGVAVEVGPLCWRLEHDDGARCTCLRLYHARLLPPARVQALAAVQLRWVLPSALGTLPFCPADVPVVEALMAGTLVLPARSAAWAG